MDYVKSKDATRFKNSDSCTAIEYEFKDENDINIAAIELSGRYPEQGYAVNTICKELVYIKNGTGNLTTANSSINLEPGDTVLIKPNERYYFDGNMELLISCSPAWSPSQYQNITD